MAKKDVGGYPIPNVIDPEETMSVTLCVPKNRDHLATFFGALSELTIWTSWQRDEEHSAVQVADVWSRYWLSWDRTLRDTECEDGMVKCCVEPIVEKRIDPVTGRPQVRYDGGAWQQDPNDPALAVTRPQPPVTSGAVDSKCTAALNAYNGMLSLIADSSSNIATASTAYELATLVAAALLNVFLLVVTGGLASPLVLTITGILWGVGTAAFELGQAGFDAYWADEDTLRELKCALVDNIGDDGSFTDAQYEAFRTQFKFNSPSSPARDFVLTSLGVGGAAGLSVMATLGDAEGGDCSECSDDCTSVAPTVTNGVFVDYDPETCIFHYQSVPFSGTNFLSLYWETDDNCVIVTEHSGSTGTPINYGWFDCGSSTYNTGPIYGGGDVWYWDKTSAAPFDMYLSFARP